MRFCKKLFLETFSFDIFLDKKQYLVVQLAIEHKYQSKINTN